MSQSKLFVVGDHHIRDQTYDILAATEGVSSISYADFLKDQRVIASGSPVFMTFPYSLWDRTIEIGDCLYGTALFGLRIKDLSDQFVEQTNKRFPSAIFVNPPNGILIDRDKIKAKNVVQNAGFQVTRDLPKDFRTLNEHIQEGGYVYIKPRYGSMGKGITYLSKDRWTTNFRLNDGVLKNHSDDLSWEEIDITDQSDLIKRILDEDFIVEAGVINPKVNGAKLDLRVRTLFSDVLEDLSYGRRTTNSSITSASQGGQRIPLDQIGQYIPERVIPESIKLALGVAKALGLNYAGCDVLFQGDEFTPIFLEVNSFPRIKVGEDIPKRILDHLERLKE